MLTLPESWAEATWLAACGSALLAVLIGALVSIAGERLLLRLTRHLAFAGAVIRAIRKPAQLVLPLLGMSAVWHAAADALPGINTVRHVSVMLLIACVTWLGLRAIAGFTEGVLERYPVTVAGNLAARRMHTQTRLLSRTAMSAVLLVGVALMLMSFPGVRQIGASLLASAGVAGLVAGIAARPVIGNLIAGLQIAIAQPIRIDDVLVVEGEWGRVEEITSTYVVLHIWDDRRLIIPLQYFVEKPFQNWTRSSAQIMGTVFLWVDWRMPLEPLRQAAQKACEGDSRWDGRVCLLQVVDTSERAVQLRILVTSVDSPSNWDLRCVVREALIETMQRECPEGLPRLRTQREADDDSEGVPPPAVPPPTVETPAP